MKDRITYEILENGYIIKLDGNPWIEQTEPYIPYPELSYEEGCLKQIEELCRADEEAKKAQNKQDEITEMQLAITELYEMMLGGTN
jgi:hypothetical protein